MYSLKTTFYLFQCLLLGTTNFEIMNLEVNLTDLIKKVLKLKHKKLTEITGNRVTFLFFFTFTLTGSLHRTKSHSFFNSSSAICTTFTPFIPLSP